MNSFRTEISIPVNKDNRTLEERRQETFKILEDKYSKPNSADPTTGNSRERAGLSNKISHDSFFDNERFFKSDYDHWNTDLSDFMQNSRKRWDEEMERVRRSMFSLESDQHEFDFNSWDPFRSSRRLGDFGKRDFDIQRQNKINNFEDSMTKKETRKTNFIPSIINDNEPISPRDDSMNNFYEFGQDGELHFKIRFEAKNFKPDDIKVTCSENNLNIVIQNSDSNHMNLHKSILVPQNVDSQKFQCHVTQDGILVLEAPVKSPDYTSLVPHDRRFTNNYKSNSLDRNQGLKIKNSSGPVILNDEKGKRLRLEIPVENEYVPSDFSVTTESNKISVKGRHEIKTPNSSSFKEFSQYYEIPESIDPMSVNFNVIDGMLIIEAAIQ